MLGLTSMLTLTMALSDAEILDLLSVATTDVYWQSESDEPFELLLWPDLAADELDESVMRQQVSAAKDVAIQPKAIDDFFEPALRLHDWYGDAEQQTVGKYEDILFLLQQNLTDLQVFRVGKCEIDVYIVGKTPAGNWLALKTMAVET